MTSKSASSSSKRAGNAQKSNSSKNPEPLSSSSTLKFFKLEDVLVKSLGGDKIAKESQEQIETIRSMLESANFGKNQELKDALLFHALKLRRLNRHSNFRNKTERDRLGEARQKVEEKHLSLQNLTNEIGHLRKNIDVCLEFQPSDSNINLVNVDEFYASAPEEISRPEVTKSDPHEQYLARLNFELAERKSMLSNLQELEGRKSALLSDIRGKEQRLGQVRTKIGAIKKATNPLLDLLGLKARHFDKTKGGGGVRQKRPNAGDGIPVQLHPMYTNEEVCREIFGTPSIELGYDAQVKIREEVMVTTTTTEVAEGDGMDTVEQTTTGEGEQQLTTTNIKDFYANEDALAESTSAEQLLSKAVGCIDFLRSSVKNGTITGTSSSALLLSRTIALRRLNRLSNFRIASFRARADKARSEVEQQTVALQNVMATVANLSKSVERCLDIPSSSDSDIDLIPTEQFFTEVPISLSRPDITRNDAHQLHLARLRHELRTRKSLVNQVLELERKKKAVLEQIGESEKALARVEPREETLKKTAKPLLDIVGLKSVALSAHDKLIPFRPAQIGADAYRELFGGPSEIGFGADQAEPGLIETEDEQLMDVEADDNDDGFMDIV